MHAAATIISVISIGFAAVNAAAIPGQPRAPAGVAVAMKTLGVPPRSSPCMGVDGNFNGVKLHPATCPDDPAPSYPEEQLWTFVRGAALAPTGAPSFVQGPSTQITFFNGQMCLDLTDGVTTAGQTVQLWSCAAEGTNPNQQWTFNSDGTITLASDVSVALTLPDSDFRPTNFLTVTVNGDLPDQTWNAIQLA